MKNEIKEKVKQILKDKNVEILCRFVPLSQSRNKDEDRKTLNWRGEIKQNDRTVFEFDYSAGIGHIPGDLHYQRSRTLAGDKVITDICETGKIRMPIAYNGDSVHDIKWLGIKTWKGTLQPELLDVLSSLVIDSEVINYSGFDEWAECFGYNTDSIRALNMYKACMETALAMRSAFGSETMEELTELFQEY